MTQKLQFRIPYDVDRFHSAGCNGTDWWGDDHGTSLRLFTSDNGSAYICPESADSNFRIFINSNGQAWRLFGVAHEGRGAYRSESATDESVRILACGVDTNPELAAELEDMTGRAQTSAVRSSLVFFEDADTIISTNGRFDLKLVFEDGAMELVRTGWLGIEDRGIIVDNVPSLSSWFTPCAPSRSFDAMTDCEGDAKTRFRTLGVSGIGEVNTSSNDIPNRADLELSLPSASGLERAMIRQALSMYDDAHRTTREILEFEEMCRSAGHPQ